jgi:hypothetical protein
MRSHGLLAIFLVAVLLPAAVAATEPVSACREAASAAERNWTLPHDLIYAIGKVESGRLEPATGRVLPWPWTVNVEGSGFWFGSRAEAISFVRWLQSRGLRMIDVGCFQVDLFYHPNAFTNLEEAFDPRANAEFAARFLTSLHGRTGDWGAAIAGYHSNEAPEGERYRQKVMHQWGASGSFTGPAEPASNPAHQQRGQDQYVVMMSAAARAISVIRP